MKKLQIYMVRALLALTLIVGGFAGSALAQSAVSGSAAATSIGISSEQNTSSGFRVCSEPITRSLMLGSRGDDVQRLQEFLAGDGYFSATVSGYFGPITMRALRNWQGSQGLISIGRLGPLTREALGKRCGVSVETCKPINYMPPLCSDGSAPQPTHSEKGCITGYECPVANFVPPKNCKAWNDGCNSCSKSDVGSEPMCTMRACFAAGKGYCSIYFNTQASVNKPPVISGISGPTTLSINASGTWTVRASDPESDNLSYSVMWGDEQLPNALSAGVSPNHAFVQTTTFTHTYSTAGTYAVTITVQDNSGGSARSSVSVRVSDSDISCTAEYAPMCGQPPEPACRRATPACMLPTPGPRTYSNQCELQKAGATLLYQGSCQDSIVACTADAMMCPNGSYVGRTGPNCQFVCP